MQRMTPRHFANDSRIPPCRLNQDVPSLFGDHGVVPAHNACQSDRLLRVAHNEVFGAQLALYAIQGLESLAVASFAYHDLSTFEQIHIEYVSWLADLPQNVIRSIDSVRDRPLIEQLQPVRNLLGRRLDVGIANDASGETRAERGFFDNDWEGCIVRGTC